MTESLRALRVTTALVSTLTVFGLWVSTDSMLLAGQAPAGRQIYVVSSGQIVAIDAATHAVTGSIVVGTTPTKVVASPDGARVYVTNTGSNTISVIDTATNAEVQTIAVGASPSALAVSPDGATLYTSIVGGIVQAIDVATAAVTASIPTPSDAGGDLAVSPDGSRVYFASGAVSVIDTGTQTVVDTFHAGTTGVEVSPDGNRLYLVTIASLFGGGLDVIDTTDGNRVVASIGAGMPGQLAMAPDGSRLYLGHSATWVDTGYGAGFFPGRSVFVIDAITNTMVGQIDLGAVGSNWSQQNTPGAIAVAPDKSRVFVSVPRLASVVAADVNTNAAEAFAPVTSPGALAATSDGSPILPFQITAVDDVATYAASGGQAIASVLANDRLGGIRPTLQHVMLAEVTPDDGLALDLDTGAVRVVPGASVGAHSLVYAICERSTPGNCDEAIATVTVRESYVIDAADDAAATLAGRYALTTVLVNDTLNGAPAALAQVTLIQVSSSSPSISLVPSNGGVFVYVGTPAGLHNLRYRICEKATPDNCDEADVAITVQAFAIDAVDDAGVVTRSGGTAVADVLANDRFNGAVATTARVTLSVVRPAGPGVTLSTAGAVIVATTTPAGSYSLVYRICETASPSNCDSATVTVTVQPYLVSAVNDYGRGSSKVANTPLASVLTNDRIGGAPATAANAAVSLVSLTPANSKIRLDVADGSVDVLGKTNSGTYVLVYRLCERSSPANCATATATIELSGR